MSALASSGISIYKKALPNSRDASFTRTICFYHQATMGQTSLNLTTLVLPPALNGIMPQITVEEIYGVNLFFNKRNITLSSSSKGELIQGLDYLVTDALTISLIGSGYASGTDADEIFVGRVLGAPMNNTENFIQSIEYKPSVLVTTNNIDWQLGFVFRKVITENTTLTFSNAIDGRAITISVHNTSGTMRTVTFPTGIWKSADLATEVEPNTKNIYTFLKEGTEITASFVTELTNL